MDNNAASGDGCRVAHQIPIMERVMPIDEEYKQAQKEKNEKLTKLTEQIALNPKPAVIYNPSDKPDKPL